MRRRLLSIMTVLIATVVVSSCNLQQKGVASGNNSSSVNTAAAGPSAGDWKGAVKGKWILNSIDRENLPQDYTVKTVFEEAPPECFIGSVWTLPSSGKGTIGFSADGRLCAPGALRNIVWSIYNPGKGMGEPEFQFKKIYAGDKASNVLTGYRLNLSYTDGEKLVLRLPLNNVAQGKAFLVLNFTKL